MSKRKRSETESPFSDITDAVEQAEVDAAQPVMDAETGERRPLVSDAQAEVARERAFRAYAATQGGGPKSREWLLERCTPQRQRRSG